MKNGKIIWMTGLSGSGKTTIAYELIKKFRFWGKSVVLLDGDILRGIMPNTGFSIAERNAHVKRTGALANMLANSGINVICALISPIETGRLLAIGEVSGGIDFYLVYVKCNIRECIRRDVKGLYKKAIDGKIKNFTGISQLYEEPKNASIIVDTEVETIKQSVNKIWGYIK